MAWTEEHSGSIAAAGALPLPGPFSAGYYAVNVTTSAQTIQDAFPGYLQVKATLPTLAETVVSTQNLRLDETSIFEVRSPFATAFTLLIEVWDWIGYGVDVVLWSSDQPISDAMGDATEANQQLLLDEISRLSQRVNRFAP